MRLLRWMAYAAVFGLGIAAGVFLLIRVSLFSSEATVPPVVGLLREQAQWQARHAHLAFLVSGERFDLRVEKGRVIEQTPRSGMSIRKGMALSVVLSKGVEKITMPNLEGLPAEEAQLQIQQAGLTFAGTSYLHLRAPSPRVMAQFPPPSEVVPRDSGVSLLVDLGPSSPVFIMPNLSSLSYQRTRQAFKSYDIAVGPARSHRVPGRPPGEIIGQSPKQGAPLSRRGLVQVNVSGP